MSNKAEPYRKFWNYEVALYRGDKLIDSGTIKEIAERRGVRKDTIYWYTTRLDTGGRTGLRINRRP